MHESVCFTENVLFKHKVALSYPWYVHFQVLALDKASSLSLNSSCFSTALPWHFTPLLSFFLSFLTPAFHKCLLWSLLMSSFCLHPYSPARWAEWLVYCLPASVFLPNTQLPLHYTPLLLSSQDKQCQWSGDKEHGKPVSAGGGQCHWGTLRQLHLRGCQQAGSHKCQPISLQ